MKELSDSESGTNGVRIYYGKGLQFAQSLDEKIDLSKVFLSKNPVSDVNSPNSTYDNQVNILNSLIPSQVLSSPEFVEELDSFKLKLKESYDEKERHDIQNLHDKIMDDVFSISFINSFKTAYQNKFIYEHPDLYDQWMEAGWKKYIAEYGINEIPFYDDHYYIPDSILKLRSNLIKKMNSNWYKFLKYSSFTYDELDFESQQHLYDKFKKSYEKSIGNSWDRDTFISKAGNWIFFGDENGYITVREQRSGMYKLTGAAGNPRSILKGLDEMLETASDKPIWGLVTSDIAGMLERRGFRVIRGLKYAPLMHLLMNRIENSKSSYFTVNWDGSLSMSVNNNTLNKYLVGNQNYFDFVKREFSDHYPLLKKIF